jgi:hypothetical protein
MESADPLSALSVVAFFPGAGKITRGDVAMCIASSSTAGLAKAWLAGDGSLLSPKLDSDLTNRTNDLPAMESVVVGVRRLRRGRIFVLGGEWREEEEKG